eukprot:GHVT01089562.1.p1 GENE.GHVT01089562.1~~GHVT01089562.1.p1  ORF type:complete len:532 (+),score=52.60 GHVT01089562.1:8174-9769(+)
MVLGWLKSLVRLPAVRFLPIGYVAWWEVRRYQRHRELRAISERFDDVCVPGALFYGRVWGSTADFEIDTALQDGDLVFLSYDPAAQHFFPGFTRSVGAFFCGTEYDEVGIVVVKNGTSYVATLSQKSLKCNEGTGTCKTGTRKTAGKPDQEDSNSMMVIRPYRELIAGNFPRLVTIRRLQGPSSYTLAPIRKALSRVILDDNLCRQFSECVATQVQEWGCLSRLRRFQIPGFTRRPVCSSPSESSAAVVCPGINSTPASSVPKEPRWSFWNSDAPQLLKLTQDYIAAYAQLWRSTGILLQVQHDVHHEQATTSPDNSRAAVHAFDEAEASRQVHEAREALHLLQARRRDLSSERSKAAQTPCREPCCTNGLGQPLGNDNSSIKGKLPAAEPPELRPETHPGKVPENQQPSWFARFQRRKGVSTCALVVAAYQHVGLLPSFLPASQWTMRDLLQLEQLCAAPLMSTAAEAAHSPGTPTKSLDGKAAEARRLGNALQRLAPPSLSHHWHVRQDAAERRAKETFMLFNQRSAPS